MIPSAHAEVMDQEETRLTRKRAEREAAEVMAAARARIAAREARRQQQSTED